MNFALERVLRPHWLALIPVLVSLGAWIVPWGPSVRRGFSDPESLTPFAVAVLFAWYGGIAAAAALGFSMGRRSRPLSSLSTASDRSYYGFFSVVAFIGVAYTYFSVLRVDPNAVARGLEGTTFNQVRYLVPYSSGLHTLRYATILAGGVALHRLFWRREVRVLHLLNLALLFASAAIASRLSLLVAGFIAAALVVRDRPSLRLTPKLVVGAGVALFLVTMPLSYYRTASFYALYFNTSNPVIINLGEIVAYVGAPFQVSVAVANHGTVAGAPDGALARKAAATYIAPSYLKVSYPEVVEAESAYAEYTDIDGAGDIGQLLTNSAFAQMFGSMGLAAFPLMISIAYASAMLAGHASHYPSYFSLTSIVVGYGFAELWRVYIFNLGLLHFLLILLTVWPVIHSFVFVTRRGHERARASNVEARSAILSSEQ
ncbi:MAG TPA: hypothetical protein VNC78_06550 [Actinomycetota bacterium]|nr:hypothetical protein [Actinomycetota bacterium]